MTILLCPQRKALVGSPIVFGPRTLVRTWGTPVDLSARDRLERETCGIPHLPKPGRYGAPGVGGGARANYSALNASTGLTEEALRAGIKLASNAAAPSTAATAASVEKSHA